MREDPAAIIKKDVIILSKNASEGSILIENN